MVDYHLHTSLCGHAEGELDDYVCRALEIGLAEAGFCDHFPLLHIQDPTLSMRVEDLPRYLREVRALRARFSDIEIKVGIEVDYVPETLPRVSEMLEDLSLDYVMGSVHFLDGWGFDDPRYVDGYRGRDILQLWRRYFQVLGEAAESGEFDVIAHPDLIKKFGYRPPGEVTDIYEACLDRLAEAGVTVEVNTAGLRKPVGEIYPTEEFLRMCREREIPVTLGSDAHAPHEVGADFGAALELLRRVGYEEIAVFRDRRRSSFSLPFREA